LIELSDGPHLIQGFLDALQFLLDVLVGGVEEE
jgi:hypothetical protein